MAGNNPRRNNITKEDVARARQQLMASGEKVTRMNIVRITGGSMTTISRLLNELEADEAKVNLQADTDAENMPEAYRKIIEDMISASQEQIQEQLKQAGANLFAQFAALASTERARQQEQHSLQMEESVKAIEAAEKECYSAMNLSDERLRHLGEKDALIAKQDKEIESLKHEVERYKQENIDLRRKLNELREGKDNQNTALLQEQKQQLDQKLDQIMAALKRK